jgi:hypothetical protein
MELGEGGKGKENDRVSVISHTVRWEGRGYKDALKAAEKQGVGGKGVRESIQRD